MFSFYEIILLFFIYGFIGWLWEIILTLFEYKKFINRGFLIGPLLPIYGCGGLIGTLLFTNLYNNSPLNIVPKIILVFIMTSIICSILEYFTSWLMEKLFHNRWWDYSKMKYNLNGRICLLCSLGFGAGCTAALAIINPFIRNTIDLIGLTSNNIKGIDLLLIFIFIIDITVSFKIINNLKRISDNISEDNTEKITTIVKKTIISNYNILYRRIIESFPNMQIQNRLSLLRNRILEEQKKLEKATYKLDVKRTRIKELEKELKKQKGNPITNKIKELLNK